MKKKKQIRAAFRNAVFKRDNYKCVCCDVLGYDRQSTPVEGKVPLDSHHITDRNDMPNGGYVKENGISVCDDCHMKAEHYHQTGEALDGFHPNDLYKLIGSSLEDAIRASNKLA